MTLVDVTCELSAIEKLFRWKAGMPTTYSYGASATTSFLPGLTLAEEVELGGGEAVYRLVPRSVLVDEAPWSMSLVLCRSGWS